MKYGYDSINYTSFADDLYDVRFELAKSRLMDINIKKLPVDYFLKSGKPVGRISNIISVSSVTKEGSP